MRRLLDCRWFDLVGREGMCMFNFKLTKTWRRSLQFILFGIMFLILQTSLAADPLLNPLEPADTSSPQATLRSFVEHVDESHEILMAAYEQYLREPGPLPSASVSAQADRAKELFFLARDTLDLSQIPEQIRQNVEIELTLMLKEVLDRIEVPPYGQIPDAAAVDSDELTRWRLPNTAIEIVKVEEGSRAGEFLFSPQTVGRLGEFYERVEGLPYKPGATEGFYDFYLATPGNLFPLKWLQNLPSWLQTLYWKQTLWQWMGLGIALFFFVWIPLRNFRRTWGRPIPFARPKQDWLQLQTPIITIVCLVAFKYLAAAFNVSGNLRLLFSTILGAIVSILIALTLYLLNSAIAETLIAYRTVKVESDTDATLVRLIFRLLGWLIGGAALIWGLEQQGITLLPLIAGFGVGGLALGLAGRTTAENMISGMYMLVHRPVGVGDFCRFSGDQLGTVKSIGLRATRIQGLDRTVTSVPNAEFSKGLLVNISERDLILLRKTIRLRYETTPEQLRYLLSKLREMLLAHPKLLSDPMRVRFLNLGDYSLDVEIFVYADTRVNAEFLGIQEDVLLRVMDIVKEAGTDFAFPSQTAYLSRDTGVDRERSLAAEAAVRAWRSKGMLPFPDVPPEQKERLRNTLDFPPKGSPNSSNAADETEEGQ